MKLVSVPIPEDADFDVWRDLARGLAARRLPPEDVHWAIGGQSGLFEAELPAPKDPAPVTATRAFVELAASAALHRDPGRFALLYRVLFRLQAKVDLLTDPSDPDVSALNRLVRAVRRDIHKMHAFVRFREVGGPNGPVLIAWYEPDHRIVAAAAPFFAERFAGLDWSILTPDASAHRRGGALTFAGGAAKEEAPAYDAAEEDWRIYYASVFNPSRLSLKAMQGHMPKKRWRNLPEAALIADLSREASGKTAAMVAAEPRSTSKRAGAHAPPTAPNAALAAVAAREAEPDSIAQISAALDACRACPLWADATQGVPGEGPAIATLMLVGEQPGDQEDLARRPFVGPAGQVLDRALAQAGLDRAQIYVTNAVKHFKNEPRGKRRLHKKPNAGEIEVCRWWLEREVALVRPRLIVALGGSAALSVFGHAGPLKEIRGRKLASRWGGDALATVHPSFLLRLPDEEAKAREFATLVEDLRLARELSAIG